MLKKILFGATLLCAAGFASAATISFEQTVAPATTNFTTTLEFAQFDTLGGTRTLESVSFTIAGDITGTAAIESLDADVADITTTLSAELSLIDSMMNTLVVTIPSITNIFSATAFDGGIDFDGTSGIAYDALTASQTESASFTDAATLASFTGTGVSSFIFDANATSSASGAGNLISQFTSAAGGLVSVVYTFSDIDTPTSVSAPSHVALLGLSLLAFAGFRKVRK